MLLTRPLSAISLLAITLTVLTACDGELKGKASFFGKVPVPVQSLEDDLKFDRILISGKSNTDKCPKGASYSQLFTGGYAAITQDGVYQSPSFTFSDYFPNTEPASCGPVDIMNIDLNSAEGVKLFAVEASLPATDANCKGFCAGKCGAAKNCANGCMKECQQAKRIAGHGGKPSFSFNDEMDEFVTVNVNLIFDRLLR